MCLAKREWTPNNIVTYLGFAWLIRLVLYLMIKFIGPLYNWLQQFTNHWHTVIFFWLDTQWELFWLPTELLHYSVLLPQFWSELRQTVPSYNSSARTPQKTPSSVVKNACLLVHYLPMDVLLLLRFYASGMCLPSRCLAMGICVTIYTCYHCELWLHVIVPCPSIFHIHIKPINNQWKIIAVISIIIEIGAQSLQRKQFLCMCNRLHRCRIWMFSLQWLWTVLSYSAYCLVCADFLLHLFFVPEDGGAIFFQNIGFFSVDYMALYPRR
jgi:hypothetical protein